METVELKISGMTCGSCEKLIIGAVEAQGGKVLHVSAKEGRAKIEIEEGRKEKAYSKIREHGYSISQSWEESLFEDKKEEMLGFEQELGAYLKGLFGNARELEAERGILKMAAFSLVVLVALSFFAYLLAWGNLAHLAKLYPFVLYGLAAEVAVLASIAHVNSYKGQATCMNGMMIGMTVGMMGGFLLGGVVGATNGMFVGSLAGMAGGMLTGYFTGKCCGIMGVMEGLMAGLMGGTMGAMLTVMMIADNLMLFMPVFFACCLAILFGLAFMLHQEQGGRERRVPISFGSFFMLALIVGIALAALILYGPKSAVVF